MERDVDSFDQTDEEFEPEREEDETRITKCPSCGANMLWSAENGCLICEYCGTREELNGMASAEQAFETLLRKDNEWSGETHVFRCDNCGAVEILDKKDISKKCSFCGTTNVVETHELSGLKPTAVVPFRISLQNAVDNVKAWAKKKFFAPRVFKKRLSPESVAGVYNPAFTFDTHTYSSYSGTLGKYCYRTKRVNGKTIRERYIRYFPISGSWQQDFDDVLVQASTRIEQKDIDKLQPFDTNASLVYKPEYLSGYSATQYTKDGMKCWAEAKASISAQIKRAILSRYVYDLVVSFDVRTACNGITYKYLLLPVYVGHFNFRKKLYNFFVSGYNGKVTGKTPVSPLRVLLVVLAAIGIAALIALASGHF